MATATVQFTPDPAPSACDVLVVGAGPAGSACARLLAGCGIDVVLADQHAFPRDKVCGDALIPDAHRALLKLGLLDAVLARARGAAQVCCVAPSGGRLEVPARLAVLPRRELDDILRRAALAAGARWFGRARFEAPLVDLSDRVVGARFTPTGGDGRPLAVQARWTVLATGAAAGPLQAAGLGSRRAPSGIALRGYVENQAMGSRITGLEVVWHRALRRGYGWIFPCANGVFNMGVGFAHGHDGTDHASAKPEANLRALFEAFTRVHPPARELMASGTRIGALKGAPLRCSLEGARWSRPGLLAAGEAIGSTYLCSGEGIGKALETGMLAAQAIIEGDAAKEAAVRARYEAALAALKPRFLAYEQANRINEHPWLADLLIWRARRDARLAERLHGVLEETDDPGSLVSAAGILKMVLPFA
jgi:menaquinone-9 beta-reductase